MFDKKQIEAYRNISAPESLRDRVMAADTGRETSEKRSLAGTIRILGTLAACLVLVAVFSVFAVGNFGDLSVSVDGKALSYTEMTFYETQSYAMQIARMPVSTEIPLSFAIDRETTFSVSAGIIEMMDAGTEETIASGTSLAASDDVRILWSVEANEDNCVFDMTVESGRKTETIRLTYKADERVWTICRVPTP